MSVKTRGHRTKSQQLQALIPRYEAAGHEWPAPLELVCKWAIAHGLYDVKPVDKVQQMKKELSQALRIDHIKDPQGRTIRKYHPFLKTVIHNGLSEQLVFWGDIERMPQPAMQASLQLRRDGVRHDCYRLEMDRESYNENWNKGALIHIDYNFVPDVAEMKQSPLPLEFEEHPLDDFD